MPIRVSIVLGQIDDAESFVRTGIYTYRYLVHNTGTIILYIFFFFYCTSLYRSDDDVLVGVSFPHMEVFEGTIFLFYSPTAETVAPSVCTSVPDTI